MTDHIRDPLTSFPLIVEESPIWKQWLRTGEKTKLQLKEIDLGSLQAKGEENATGMSRQ